jgi:GT2 family glycosyltransferase
MPKISIILIHYNTPQFLKTCLDHIFDQSYENIETYFIDNNSPSKEGLEFVKKNYAQKQNSGRLHIIANKENLGYAKAANQGIRMAISGEHGSKADYIVITNPDIIYSPTYFEKVVSHITPGVAGITGKVYKYDFTNKKPTKIIDTVGLYIDRRFRVSDGAQGTEDKGQFDKEKEVFGISGACPLYSVKALEEAKIQLPDSPEEYFDEDFFMYKEDVDLSWRLQLLGWKFLYYPKAVAFHGRGTGVIERKTNWQIVRSRKFLNKFQRYYSFRNQRLMVMKNALLMNYIRNFFQILINDVATLFYLLFFEPSTLKALFSIYKLSPKIARKRKLIMAKRKIGAGKINKWMKAKP